MVRIKKRYLVIRFEFLNSKSKRTIDREDIFQAVKGTLKELYGDYGVAAYGPHLNVKYTNPHTSIFFLQCLRDHYKQIRACVTFVKVMQKELCVLTCLKVAATIKLAERFLLAYNIKAMNVLYKRCKTPMEKNNLLKLMKEFDVPVEGEVGEGT